MSAGSIWQLRVARRSHLQRQCNNSNKANSHNSKANSRANSKANSKTNSKANSKVSRSSRRSMRAAAAPIRTTCTCTRATSTTTAATTTTKRWSWPPWERAPRSSAPATPWSYFPLWIRTAIWWPPPLRSRAIRSCSLGSRSSSTTPASRWRCTTIASAPCRMRYVTTILMNNYAVGL